MTDKSHLKVNKNIHSDKFERLINKLNRRENGAFNEVFLGDAMKAFERMSQKRLKEMKEDEDSRLIQVRNVVSNDAPKSVGCKTLGDFMGGRLM